MRSIATLHCMGDNTAIITTIVRSLLMRAEHIRSFYMMLLMILMGCKSLYLWYQTMGCDQLASSNSVPTEHVYSITCIHKEWYMYPKFGVEAVCTNTLCKKLDLCQDSFELHIFFNFQTHLYAVHSHLANQQISPLGI